MSDEVQQLQIDALSTRVKSLEDFHPHTMTDEQLRARARAERVLRGDDVPFLGKVLIAALLGCAAYGAYVLGRNIIAVAKAEGVSPFRVTLREALSGTEGPPPTA